MAEATPAPRSGAGPTAQLQALWHTLADDPQRQAWDCAEFCLQHAAHQVEWLKHKIAAVIPDTLYAHLLFHNPSDLRIQALKRRHRSVKFRMGELGDPNQPVYVYLGDHERSQSRIFEINNSGFVMSVVNERETPQEEAWYFAHHPPTWVESALAYWRHETGQDTAKLGHFLEGQ